MDLTVVRDAGIEDARRLLEIYRYYVERTAISFEYDVPTLAEFQARIREPSRALPMPGHLWGGQLTAGPVS